MISGKQAKSAREKSAEFRREQEAAERRKRRIVVAMSVVVALLAVVGIGYAVQSSRTKTAANSPSPRNTTADYGFAFGPEKGVMVETYEDFQCPACKNFEDSGGKTVKELVASEQARSVYFPIAILDHASTTKYATRALNAIACVADTNIDAFLPYHDKLYANQPPEGGAGLPDDQLIALAKEVGVTTIDSCITDRKFEGWTAKATEAASKRGVNATPTVYVDDAKLDTATPEAITKAVTEASK